MAKGSLAPDVCMHVYNFIYIIIYLHTRICFTAVIASEKTSG